MVGAVSYYKNPWIVGSVLVIFGVLFFSFSSSKGVYDSFATCLSTKNVVMYGTDWCPHCQAQKVLFGNSFKKVTYVNCDTNKDSCARHGVTGYPTWIIDGAPYTGEQPLEKLAALSGCELVKNA